MFHKVLKIKNIWALSLILLLWGFPAYAAPDESSIRLGGGIWTHPTTLKPRNAHYCPVCKGRGFISARYTYRIGTIVLGNAKFRSTLFVGSVDNCFTCNMVGWLPNLPWGGPSDASDKTPHTTSRDNVSSNLKDKVNANGRNYGCWSCGRINPANAGQTAAPLHPQSGRYIADHVPPVSTMTQWVTLPTTDDILFPLHYPTGARLNTTDCEYALKPHCTTCSNSQSSNTNASASEYEKTFRQWTVAMNIWLIEGGSFRPPQKDSKSLSIHTLDFRAEVAVEKAAGMTDSHNTQ